MHVLSLYKLYGKFEMTSTFDLYLYSVLLYLYLRGTVRGGAADGDEGSTQLEGAVARVPRAFN